MTTFLKKSTPKTETAHAGLVLPKEASGGASASHPSDLDLQTRSFPPCSSILVEGSPCDSVLLVREGWLALSKSLADGHTQIFDFALPGEIVDPFAADQETSFVAVDSLTSCIVAIVPTARWERMTEALPHLRRYVHCMDSAGHSRRAERMLRLGKGTAEMRLAYALLELWIRSGEGACDSRHSAFHIPLTQTRLGDFIGLSSVHVCRMMRHLARNGMISADDHMDIRILDPDVLAEVAGVDLDNLRGEILPVPRVSPLFVAASTSMKS